MNEGNKQPTPFDSFVSSLGNAETHEQVRRLVTQANSGFNLSGRARRQLIAMSRKRLTELGPESFIDRVIAWSRRPARTRKPQVKLTGPMTVNSKPKNYHPRGMFRLRDYIVLTRSRWGLEPIESVTLTHNRESRKGVAGNARNRRFARRHPEHFPVQNLPRS